MFQLSFLVLLLWIICCYGELLSSARMSVSESSLNELAIDLLPLVENEIRNYPLESQEAVVNVPVLGDVVITLSEVHIQEINIRKDNTISILKDNHVILQDRNAFAYTVGNWKSRQKNFPHLSDSGTFSAVITSNFNLNFELVIDESKSGHMKLSVNSFDIQITDFDLTLHSKFSWLLSIFIELFKSKIVSQVEKVFQSVVPTLVEKMTQQQLDQFQFVFALGPEDWNLQLNFDMLKFSTNTTEKMITFSTKGIFTKKDIPDFPDEPQYLKNVYFMKEGMKQIQFLMDEHTMNSLSYVLHKSNMLQHTLDLPESLSTSAFKDIIPGLYERFPDHQMKASVATTTPPQWTIDRNGTTLRIESETTFFVIRDAEEDFNAFTVGTNLYFDVHGTVEDQNPTLLKFKITFLPEQTECWNKTSNVGEIKSLGLIGVGISMMANKVLQDIVQPYASQGFPLPHIPSLRIVNSQIDHYKGFLVVNSNFKPDILHRELH